MCPYCYEPKDVKGHPLECTKLQSIIKTELQKHKFSYIIAKLNVETCLEGKEVIDLFIDNSKCKATTVLKKYFDILSNNTGKKSKVGYEGRLVKNKHLKILIQNQQKRKKTLFENIDPQNPESQFFSKEKNSEKKLKNILKILILKTLGLYQRRSKLSSGVYRMIKKYIQVLIANEEQSQSQKNKKYNHENFIFKIEQKAYKIDIESDEFRIIKQRIKKILKLKKFHTNSKKK
ncbi:hypothetical protein M0813_18869 [Anaeramoeba flamelloides]|uniref:Uncharacterized protein n=1 Tax=Anaeramoeba flamelloides TaxID=1746091 RepID=A0ABQ8YRU9_9EUKA|nr:hypothetical protein M0813_18869 [Anaeramoeba flamelloides]